MDYLKREKKPVFEITLPQEVIVTSSFVVSGPKPALKALRDYLKEKFIECPFTADEKALQLSAPKGSVVELHYHHLQDVKILSGCVEHYTIIRGEK